MVSCPFQHLIDYKIYDVCVAGTYQETWKQGAHLKPAFMI